MSKKELWKQPITTLATELPTKICYIIAEGFSFILSFFVLYILSFGLVKFRAFRLSAWVGADINAGVHAGRM